MLPPYLFLSVYPHRGTCPLSPPSYYATCAISEREAMQDHTNNDSRKGVLCLALGGGYRIHTVLRKWWSDLIALVVQPQLGSGYRVSKWTSLFNVISMSSKENANIYTRDQRDILLKSFEWICLIHVNSKISCRTKKDWYVSYNHTRSSLNTNRCHIVKRGK